MDAIIVRLGQKPNNKEHRKLAKADRKGKPDQIADSEKTELHRNVHENINIRRFFS